jgi:ligand-binding SRPBCC domain-containing protein
MKIHQLRRQLWLPLPPEKLFPFFADATNLEAITPPWLKFQVLTPNIVMGEGTLIEYRLRVHGFPLRWHSRIVVWQPPHRFVDEELRGPYRRWIHEHSFEEQNGGTLVRDHVHYAVWFDFFVHRLLVRPDVERIFKFRAEALWELFGQKQGQLKKTRVLADRDA